MSLVFSFNVFAGITIVSDLDETIQITNSGSAVGAVTSAFKKNRTYTGIPEFFQGTENYVEKVYVISASPTILRRKIRTALNNDGIRHDGIVLKEWTKFEDRLKYKVRKIKELMENSNNDFLLLGDDVGDDPEVYAEIKRLFPGRVVESYIHVIKNRKVPSNVVTYYTAHDLALREQAAGRMSSEAVGRVISKMKAEWDLKYIFPKFANCPKSSAAWAWQFDTDFADEVLDLNNKLVSYCVMQDE